MSLLKLGFVLPAGKGNGKTFSVFGQTIFERITSEDSAGDYYVFDEVTPPGMGVPPHRESLEDEIVTVRNGDFEVFLDGSVSKVSTGAILNFARGTLHGFRCVGNLPGETTWIVSPGQNGQAFIRKLATFPPGPPDFKMLNELHKKHGIEMEVPLENWW
jgi:quercetin dioxygenase-like cupin family protein